MKQKIKQALKHPLIYGSSIVVIGNLIANFFNLLFNTFMLGHLHPADYGILASLIAIIGFPLLIAAGLTPMMVRFAGTYFAKGDIPLLRGFYLKMKKMFFIIALVIFVLYFIFIENISQFFHINNIFILSITNLTIFIAFLCTVNTAFIQAKLSFTFQSIVNLVNAVAKLILGIMFVFMGYSVSGAGAAIFIAALISYSFSFIPFKFIFAKGLTTPKIETKELILYALPSAITQLGLNAFISSDILLVKHFFEPTQAGFYAGLSLVGRVIFYVSAPIGTVMFPLIIRKHSKNENYTNTFKLALLLIALPSFGLTFLYYLFPNFFIMFFTNQNEKYLTVAPLLVYFSLFTSLYSILAILATFYLAIKKTKVYIPIIGGAIIQVVLIAFFHTTFFQVIMISLTITFVLVCLLLLYYPYATKR
jgi:O-antigen/teichoic acid export membrane protein